MTRGFACGSPYTLTPGQPPPGRAAFLRLSIGWPTAGSGRAPPSARRHQDTRSVSPVSAWAVNSIVQPAVASSGSTQRPTSRFRLRSRPLAAPARNLRLASPASHSGSTGGQLLRLGSMFCRRLDQWQTSDFRRRYALPFDLRLTFQLSLASFRRQGRGPTFDSHRILILQLGSCPASGSHRLLLQPSACAVCCCGV